MQHKRIKNPNWQEATSWLFTSVAEDLNSELLWKNPAIGQSVGTRTRGTAGLRVQRADHSATLPPPSFKFRHSWGVKGFTEKPCILYPGRQRFCLLSLLLMNSRWSRDSEARNPKNNENVSGALLICERENGPPEPGCAFSSMCFSLV